MKKSALILGGSSGIGKATVAKLAQTFKEIVVVHRDRKIGTQDFKDFISQLESNYPVKISAFNFDATDKLRSEEVLSEITVKKFDVVLHSLTRGNLGSMNPEEARPLRKEDLTLTIEAMSLSVKMWVDLLMAHKMLARDARFITLTSEGSMRYWPGYAAVGMAKASLETLIKYLAVEMSQYGIRFNCLNAGVTDTPSLRLIQNSDSLLKTSKKRNPSGRLTTPEDVANAVYLLTLPEASWINGAIIHVDGGEHLV